MKKVTIKQEKIYLIHCYSFGLMRMVENIYHSNHTYFNIVHIPHICAFNIHLTQRVAMHIDVF